MWGGGGDEGGGGRDKRGEQRRGEGEGGGGREERGEQRRGEGEGGGGRGEQHLYYRQCVRVSVVDAAQTLNASSTRSLLLSAACVQVIAMILASFTSR